MRTVDFKTPTLNEKGEILGWMNLAAQQFTEYVGNEIELDMILVPRGFFQMGSPRSSLNNDEKPQHLVSIRPFLMGKCLVTQGQWRAVMRKLPPCRFKGEGLPVERVSWKDAQAFCRKLSEKAGREYRLPSETQWEYACRAGTATPFSFGETLTVEVANFNGEHTFREEPRGFYRHVTNAGGTFPPNAFGLHDMHGNLWEWCADHWLEDYSSSPRDDSAYQKKDDSTRVARGGSWHEPPSLCRSASRLRMIQSEAEEFTGFRVVCEVVV
ncbi:MAG: formylglycine-generating enzyme family protein [Bacteroidota bacterium]